MIDDVLALDLIIILGGVFFSSFLSSLFFQLPLTDLFKKGQEVPGWFIINRYDNARNSKTSYKKCTDSFFFFCKVLIF